MIQKLTIVQKAIIKKMNEGYVLRKEKNKKILFKEGENLIEIKQKTYEFLKKKGYL